MIAIETLYLTAVAIGGRGVLIEGPSGAGKSDLALRLIDRGATLVGDDYIEAMEQDGVLWTRAPARIAGRMEVRGVGILAMAFLDRAPAALLVTLLGEPDRLPEPARRRLLGVELPVLALDPRAPSAPIKVELALAHGVGVIA